MQVLVPPRGGPGGTVGLDALCRARLRRGPTNNHLAAPGPRTCVLPGPGSLPSAGHVRRGRVTARGSGQAWDLRRRQIPRGRQWGGLGTPRGGPRVCRRGYAASCHTESFWEDVWAAGWRALGGCSPRVPPSRGSSTGPAPPAASRRLPSPLALPEAAEALDGVCVRGAGGRGSLRPRWAVWVARPESWVRRAVLPLISGAAGGVSRGAPLCRLAWNSGWGGSGPGSLASLFTQR